MSWTVPKLRVMALFGLTMPGILAGLDVPVAAVALLSMTKTRLLLKLLSFAVPLCPFRSERLPVQGHHVARRAASTDPLACLARRTIIRTMTSREEPLMMSVHLCWAASEHQGTASEITAGDSTAITVCARLTTTASENHDHVSAGLEGSSWDSWSS